MNTAAAYNLKREPEMQSIPQIMQLKNSHANAAVYMDYDNILELLRKYDLNPMQIDFFPVILKKLKEEHQLNIIDFIVYSNFEKAPFLNKHQTIIQGLGLETRHSSNNGKNSGDLEMTVDALRTLYKNPSISIFVLISSDRDIIPLIKAIKYENKISYVLSTRTGFNQVVARYADHHEYIEDIFNLTRPAPAGIKDSQKVELEINNVSITREDIEKAKQVSRMFLDSKVRKSSLETGEAVSLTGYTNILSKSINRFPAEIINDFKLAHHLGYITIYRNTKKGLCIKDGEKGSEI
ncbi:MAG: NYN domain-containing protein [Bacillota bacterium]